MAELIIPLARRSGEVGTRHLVAGVMARGVERALAGFAERMAARHTIAQLRALDDRTLHDIGLHRSEIGSLALDVGADRIRRATIERDLLNAAVHPASRRQRCWKARTEARLSRELQRSQVRVLRFRCDADEGPDCKRGSAPSIVPPIDCVRVAGSGGHSNTTSAVEAGLLLLQVRRRLPAALAIRRNERGARRRPTIPRRILKLTRL